MLSCTRWICGRYGYMQSHNIWFELFIHDPVLQRILLGIKQDIKYPSMNANPYSSLTFSSAEITVQKPRCSYQIQPIPDTQRSADLHQMCSHSGVSWLVLVTIAESTACWRLSHNIPLNQVIHIPLFYKGLPGLLHGAWSLESGYITYLQRWHERNDYIRDKHLWVSLRTYLGSLVAPTPIEGREGGREGGRVSVAFPWSPQKGFKVCTESYPISFLLFFAALWWAPTVRGMQGQWVKACMIGYRVWSGSMVKVGSLMYQTTLQPDSDHTTMIIHARRCAWNVCCRFWCEGTHTYVIVSW